MQRKTERLARAFISTLKKTTLMYNTEKWKHSTTTTYVPKKQIKNKKQPKTQSIVKKIYANIHNNN